MYDAIDDPYTYENSTVLNAMIESFEGDEKELARVIRGLIA